MAPQKPDNKVERKRKRAAMARTREALRNPDLLKLNKKKAQGEIRTAASVLGVSRTILYSVVGTASIGSVARVSRPLIRYIFRRCLQGVEGMQRFDRMMQDWKEQRTGGGFDIKHEQRNGQYELIVGWILAHEFDKPNPNEELWWSLLDESLPEFVKQLVERLSTAVGTFV